MFGFEVIDSERSLAAVLLVMLPLLGPRSRHASAADLATLQSRLGPAVRVLQIDEASHPAILSSFAPAQLPTSVLMHHGVELWRRPGLPEAAEIAALLVGRGANY